MRRWPWIVPVFVLGWLAGTFAVAYATVEWRAADSGAVEEMQDRIDELAAEVAKGKPGPPGPEGPLGPAGPPGAITNADDFVRLDGRSRLRRPSRSGYTSIDLSDLQSCLYELDGAIDDLKWGRYVSSVISCSAVVGR